MAWLIHMCLCVTGLFTLVLGCVHFFMPLLFDFRGAIPPDGPPLRPLRLGPIQYGTRRSDIHGIVWVMNHAVSFTLVSIGVVDLAWSTWRGFSFAQIVLGWIAAFMFLRAAAQLHLGRRPGDLWIMAGFTWLGILHVLALLA